MFDFLTTFFFCLVQSFFWNPRRGWLPRVVGYRAKCRNVTLRHFVILSGSHSFSRTPVGAGCRGLSGIVRKVVMSHCDFLTGCPPFPIPLPPPRVFLKNFSKKIRVYIIEGITRAKCHIATLRHFAQYPTTRGNQPRRGSGKRSAGPIK
jgi:hypothetical protein